jgi:dihydrofolate reductase
MAEHHHPQRRPHRLDDELRLMVFPVLLGQGKRLFPEGEASTASSWPSRRPPATASRW